MVSAGTSGTLRDMLSAVAPVHRLSIEDVRRMYETGILDEHDRLELLDGVLVEMSPIGPEHSGAVAWLNQHLSRPDCQWHVRVQDTLVIEGGFLLPDLTVIAEQPSRTRLVETAMLAVEVAQTSQQRDAEKAQSYARAGVREYWIVDLVARVVIVHGEPHHERYRVVDRYSDGALLAVPVDVPAIDVSALLG